MKTFDLSGGHLCDRLVFALRAEILSGTFAAGERLPSKRRLAEHHHISVATVQNAYEQLIAEGYIESRERRGYFVAAGVLSPATPHAPAPTVAAEPAEQEPFLDLVTNAADASRFPFALWSRLSRRVLAEEKDLLASSPAAGTAVLRRAVADYLAGERGIVVSPEQIVIGAGNEYFYQLLIPLFGKERRYALENPGYTKIARICALNGVRFSPVSVDGEGVSTEELAALDADILHLTPNHHFPTGVLTSAARRAALLSWVREGDRLIVEDDYDSEFRFTGRPIPPLFSADGSGRVIYMNTFSKTIAPSIRIGYMVLPWQLLARYRERIGVYTCPVPVFEQYTLARFLGEGYFERHLHRMRTFYRARRDAVIGVLRAAPFAERIEIKEADAGLHFLLTIKTDRGDGALRDLFARAGVRVAFLEDYRIDGVREDTHTLVFNYSGVDPARLAAGVEKIAGLL